MLSIESGCIVCGAQKHRHKIFFYKKYKELKPAEKESFVKKLVACLECHDDDDDYLCRNKDCKRGASSDHHYFLCPKAVLKDMSDWLSHQQRPQERKQTDRVG